MVQNLPLPFVPQLPQKPSFSTLTFVFLVFLINEISLSSSELLSLSLRLFPLSDPDESSSASSTVTSSPLLPFYPLLQLQPRLLSLYLCLYFYYCYSRFPPTSTSTSLPLPLPLPLPPLPLPPPPPPLVSSSNIVISLFRCVHKDFAHRSRIFINIESLVCIEYTSPPHNEIFHQFNLSSLWFFVLVEYFIHLPCHF